jgi:hypothetical protein
LAQDSITAQSLEENASSSGTIGSHAEARFRVDNNVVTGPAPTGTLVPATLNLNVRAFIGVNASGTGGFGGTVAQADLLLDVSLPGSRHVGAFLLSIGNQRPGPDLAFGGTGLFEALEADVEVDNPSFLLSAQVPISLDLALAFSAPVNTPFTMDVFERAQTLGGFNLSAAEGGWTHHVGGLIDFVDTVSFPTGSRVMDLPAGFTFNSVDGLVIDNIWLGAPAIPEPTTWLLMSLGLAMAGVRCRRRAFERPIGEARSRSRLPRGPPAQTRRTPSPQGRAYWQSSAGLCHRHLRSRWNRLIRPALGSLQESTVNSNVPISEVVRAQSTPAPLRG